MLIHIVGSSQTIIICLSLFFVSFCRNFTLLCRHGSAGERFCVAVEVAIKHSNYQKCSSVLTQKQMKKVLGHSGTNNRVGIILYKVSNCA